MVFDEKYESLFIRLYSHIEIFHGNFDIQNIF